MPKFRGESNYLEETIVALAAERVKFIICGGVAAVLHGVERMTLDLDLSIDLSPANITRAAKVFKQLGLQPRVPVPIDSLSDQSVVDMMVNEKHAIVFTMLDPDLPIRHVDIFLTTRLSYHVLQPDTIMVTVGTHRVKVLSPQKLLDLKKAIMPPRQKDALDIATLSRIIDAD